MVLAYGRTGGKRYGDGPARPSRNVVRMAFQQRATETGRHLRSARAKSVFGRTNERQHELHCGA
jgi:hypothetical protein